MLIFKIERYFPFQVEDSYLIRYLPTKSTEEEGLESATLGLSYEVTDFHFAPTVHPGNNYSETRF